MIKNHKIGSNRNRDLAVYTIYAITGLLKKEISCNLNAQRSEKAFKSFYSLIPPFFLIDSPLFLFNGYLYGGDISKFAFCCKDRFFIRFFFNFLFHDFPPILILKGGLSAKWQEFNK